jgi:hypothetical protein
MSKKFVHKADASGLDFRKIQSDGPGELMLLQTSDWINAKDGATYKDIWGRVRVVPIKAVLGFEPRGHITNFVYQVGEGENAVFVMGCRVLYAHICLEKPTNKNCYVIEDTGHA